MHRTREMIFPLILLFIPAPCWAQSESAQPPALPYCVVDTGQTSIFSDQGQLLNTPQPSEPFFGQDAQYQSPAPKYTQSTDGLTVHDNNTGLIWQRSPEVNGDGELNPDDKLTWAKTQARPDALNAARFGGYNDWRLPTIKELYSLIDFQGVDPSPLAADAANLTPFIDAGCFEFIYGDTRFGERVIDSQYAASTVYVHKIGPGSPKLFGVNFADGRIKGYDLTMPGGREKSFYYQRGGSRGLSVLLDRDDARHVRRPGCRLRLLRQVNGIHVRPVARRPRRRLATQRSQVGRPGKLPAGARPPG